jgi:4-diphosphocytidyl-2-C-methyl-D-erythritol kinase
MVSFPPCKINLGLNILRKRPDGYHELETCFYPVPWTDILEIIPSKNFSFQSSGNPIPGSEQENLCLKAYRLLQRDFNIPPVSIHLHKIIPTGAGLGGGSADAAHTVRLLNQIFNLSLSFDQLRNYTDRLGSDCSFFLQDNPLLGQGRGEILTPILITLKGNFLVIVKPPLHVSTAEAYADVAPHPAETPLRHLLETVIPAEWRGRIKNDFEESIFKKYPAIRLLKDKLYNEGALYASMSGSGSSVFGIFSNEVSLNFPPDHLSWSGWL